MWKYWEGRGEREGGRTQISRVFSPPVLLRFYLDHPKLLNNKKIVFKKKINFIVSCWSASDSGISILHCDLCLFSKLLCSLLFDFCWRPCFFAPHKLNSILFTTYNAGTCSTSIKPNWQLCGEHEQMFGECLQFLRGRHEAIAGFCQADKLKGKKTCLSPAKTNVSQL